MTDYICHYGVKGMKWGVRKKKDSASSEKDLNAARRATIEAGRINQIAKKRVSKRDTSKSPAKKMSDKELREKINRELLERQYDQLFYESYRTKGRARLEKILDVSGDVLAVTSSAIAIALALKRISG